MAKLLREKYKTYEGARKRAGFENGVAWSEFKSGYKACHYHYTIVAEGDGWRVQRCSGYVHTFAPCCGRLSEQKART